MLKKEKRGASLFAFLSIHMHRIDSKLLKVSNIDARLLAVGFELEKLIRHVEVMILMFDQQVTPAMRSAHYHHSLAAT